MSTQRRENRRLGIKTLNANTLVSVCYDEQGSLSNLYLARPAAAYQKQGGLYVLLLFLIYVYLFTPYGQSKPLFVCELKMLISPEVCCKQCSSG